MDYDILIIGAGVVGLSISEGCSKDKKASLLWKRMKVMEWRPLQGQAK